MTRDDIIHMAIEAGLHDEMWFGPHTPTNYEDCLPKIERFAELVAAEEREACAKVAESYEPRCDTCPSGVSNAIRARGQHD